MTDLIRAVPPPRLVPDDRDIEGFRLDVDEPVALGMRRIVLEQIDFCVHLVREEPDIDRCAHELRKAIKRTRAVLRLMRGELGRFRYREENVVLRDTARRWAAVRDARVMAKVAAEFAAETGVLGDVLGRRLIGVLEGRAVTLREAAAEDRRLGVDTLTNLLCFRARVARFPVVGPGAFPDRFSAIRPGLARVSRRASGGLTAAAERPVAVELHEWRKQVKYLRHQVEVVEPVWEDLLGATAQRLSILGDVLGDDHDLAELGGLIAADPDLVPDERWRHRALVTLEERRRSLQGEAFALGRSVLGPPGDLVAQVERAWEYARA